MRTRRSGRIVEIESEVAHRPPPRRSDSATAKNAQVGLTRPGARADPAWYHRQCRAPGFVPVEHHAGVTDDVRSSYVASVPTGRFGTRDEIAYAVSLLASEEAAFVTGQRLVVDGGRVLS